MSDDDLDEIPVDIMRVAQDVSRTWRRCHRKACKRARGCRGWNVPCAGERPRVTPRDPDKAARDDARAMAILQRMLRERLEAVERASHATSAREPAKPVQTRVRKPRRRRLTVY